MLSIGQIDSGEYAFSLFSVFEKKNIFTASLSAITTVFAGLLIHFNCERYTKRYHFSYHLVFFYAIMMCFYGYFSITVEHLALLFFLFSFTIFSKCLNNHEARKLPIYFFNLSFLLSLGSLFVPHLIFTLPLFWISGGSIGQFNLRAFIASLLAFVLPYVLADAFIFAFCSEEMEYIHRFVYLQMKSHDFIDVEHLLWQEYAVYTGPLILLIISIISTFSKTFISKTIVRKFNLINLVFLLYLLLATVLGIVEPHFGLMLLWVPAVYFFANFWHSVSAVWLNVFLGVLIISAILSYPLLIEKINTFYQTMVT